MAGKRTMRRRRRLEQQRQAAATKEQWRLGVVEEERERQLQTEETQEHRAQAMAEEERQRQAAEKESRWLQREADLEVLIREIEAIQARAKRYQDIIGLTETHTRMALIDPLLCALGWDTSDPACVIPEYRAGGGLADYALLKMTPEGEAPKPIAFIEAKRLGEALVPHRPQMLNYANMSGVKYAGLTNGDSWELYEVFKEAPLDDRRIFNISLRQDSAFDCALQFLWLNWSTLATGQLLSADEVQRLLFKAVDAKAKPKVVGMLLDHGADVSGKALNGCTPLHYGAARSDEPATVGLLLDRGADIGMKDNFGMTPLHWAALMNPDVGITRLLLHRGADITAQDNNGGTPVDAAQLNENKEVVALLNGRGTDTAGENLDEWQSLRQAALIPRPGFPPSLE